MSYREIQKAFGHKLIGSKSTKKTVCETLLIFPPVIIDFVTRRSWIVSSFDDGWAFTLRAGEIKKGEFLIFLSDELLNAGLDRIRYTLAHEIGHVYLGHRNSIGKIQSKAEIRKQERQADTFAIYFLKKRED